MSWEKVRLGDVTDSCLGKMLDQEKNKGDYQKYLANLNVRWGSFDLENLSEMRFEPDESERYGLMDGDLVICEGGEPGRCAIWKNQMPNMKIQKALHRVRVHDCIDNRYLFYWFLLAGKNKILDQYFTGSTIKHMPGQKLKEVIIDKPPIEIQRRMADILSAYDDLIENNQKQIRLLEEAAQQLYKEWFINLHFPGYEDTPVVGDIPYGWENRTIDSFVDLLSGFAFKSHTFNNCGRYKIVTIKNVQDGKFDGQNVSHIDEIPTKLPKHCYLSDGDILLSLTGNVGRICIVVGEDFLLNQRVAKLQSKYKAFTYCLFRSNEMYTTMNNLANGAAQQNLSPIRTGKIIVNIPPEAILLQFENLVSRIIDGIVSLSKKNNLLVQARDRLLPKLMSGALEV